MLPYMEEQKKTKEDNVKNVADANTDVTHKPLAYFIFKTNKNKYQKQNKKNIKGISSIFLQQIP